MIVAKIPAFLHHMNMAIFPIKCSGLMVMPVILQHKMQTKYFRVRVFFTC